VGGNNFELEVGHDGGDGAVWLATINVGLDTFASELDGGEVFLHLEVDLNTLLALDLADVEVVDGGSDNGSGSHNGGELLIAALRTDNEAIRRDNEQLRFENEEMKRRLARLEEELLPNAQKEL